MAAPGSVGGAKDIQRIACVGGWTLDQQTGKLTWSDEVFRLFEIAPEQFDGTYAAFLNVIHPDDRDALNRAYTDSLATRMPYEITHRLLMPDGRIKWLHEKCETEFDAAGKALRSHGVVQDVTEHHEAMMPLRVSHETLCSILETTLDGYWCFNAQGRLLDVNPAYSRQSGYTRAELLRMRIPDLEAVESAVETAEHIRYIMQNGGDLFESKHRRKDGSVWQVEVSTTYRHTATGGEFFAFFRDITERKRIDAELRIAAATFESQEGMLVTDADGVILRINRAFTEITGYTPEDIVGKTPRLLKSERHDAEFFRRMWETINLTGSWQGEIWDRRKNGEVYPKWLTISAVRDADGVVTHYVGTHTDITERKQAEDRVRQLAFYDPLTQLPNRRLFNDRFSQTMAASKRSACYGAAMFVDLDNFKPLNDTHGHAVGDLLLIEAAQRLKNCLREMDTVARFGGDEFVVMLGKLDRERAISILQAESVAEKIRASLSAPYRLNIKSGDGTAATIQHQCTASIGVSLFLDHEDSLDDILKRADAAMYRAKEAGRNSIRFHERMDEWAAARSHAVPPAPTFLASDDFQLPGTPVEHGGAYAHPVGEGREFLTDHVGGKA